MLYFIFPKDLQVMENHWEGPLRWHCLFLKNIYVTSFPSYVKVVLLTRILAEFPKKEG